MWPPGWRLFAAISQWINTASLMLEMSLISSTQDIIQMWAERSLCFFQPPVLGRAPCRDDDNQRAVAAVKPCSPDSVLSNLPVCDLHPAMSSLGIHPHYAHSSPSAGKPEPCSQCGGSHTRGRTSQRPQHGWLAFCHRLSFLRTHIFPQHASSVVMLCPDWGGLSLGKHLHAGTVWKP